MRDTAVAGFPGGRPKDLPKQRFRARFSPFGKRLRTGISRPTFKHVPLRNGFPVLMVLTMRRLSSLPLPALFFTLVLLSTRQPASLLAQDTEARQPVLVQTKATADDGESPEPKPDANEKPDESPAIPFGSQDALLSVITKLSPQSMRKLGSLLEEDWKAPPEWGQEAIAILKGDGMRPGVGWWKAPEKRYDFKWLREKFDRDGDGTVTLAELPESVPDREQLFTRLDRDLDGKLLLLDFDWYNRSLSTPRAMMSDFLAMRLDADSNGQISVEEITEFFQNADKEKTGFLTHEDLFSALDTSAMGGGRSKPLEDAEIMRMFLRGEIGTLESGPELESMAPDFTLPTYDAARNVTLSEHRGKRPVVLIFGSFT